MGLFIVWLFNCHHFKGCVGSHCLDKTTLFSPSYAPLSFLFLCSNDPIMLCNILLWLFFLSQTRRQILSTCIPKLPAMTFSADCCAFGHFGEAFTQLQSIKWLPIGLKCVVMNKYICYEMEKKCIWITLKHCQIVLWIINMLQFLVFC